MTKTKEKCSCVCCGEVMDNLASHFDDKGFQPSGGVAFRSYGHYGSAEFDPMDSSFVEVVLCDECFKFLLQCGLMYKSFSEQLKEEENLD